MYLDRLLLFICMPLIGMVLGSPYKLNGELLNLATGVRDFNVNKVAHNAPTPPDIHDYIAMARFVVHQVGWVAFSTISKIDKIQGFPFANVVTMADGPINVATGIPYFYITPRDFTAIDLEADNRCTVFASLEQTGYCDEENYEPDDPRCARVMLSGSIIKLKNGTEENQFARDALFTRHPGLKKYPRSHGFFFAKLDIKHIVMLDRFGGPTYLDVEKYIKFNDTKLYKNNREAILIKNI